MSQYVCKYATKDMLAGNIVYSSPEERRRNRRPRILASRAPTYGDPMIIRDAELVQELAKANQKELTEIWETNLKQMVWDLRAAKEAGHRLSIQRRILLGQSAGSSELG